MASKNLRRENKGRVGKLWWLLLHWWYSMDKMNDLGKKSLVLNDDNCQRGKQTSCLSLLD